MPRITERELFILRIMLMLTLVYTTVFSAVYPQFAAINRRTSRHTAEMENGMSGGKFQEQLAIDSETETYWELILSSFELLGIPEPEEFSRPKLLIYDAYKVVSGDTISGIAMRVGLNEDTLLSVNAITNSRLLQINRILKIPNQDGIFYTARANDTIQSIAAQYDVDPEAIKTVNELFSDSITANASLFIPGARMNWVDRQEINGDLFIWPVSGYVTSPYGYREDPFGRGRQFHYGIDIGAPFGTIIRAAMSGRVAATGYDNSYGNYVIINHHSGYRTLYAHLSTISVRAGAYVVTGERIGLVGSTGLSTAPHLHFTVYKNGVTVNPRSLMK